MERVITQALVAVVIVAVWVVGIPLAVLGMARWKRRQQRCERNDSPWHL